MKRAPTSMVIAGVVPFVLVLTGCPDNKPPQPLTTSVGKSVATLVRSSGTGFTGTGACPTAGTPPAPNIQGWWSSQPPNNRLFPFAGFEIWRNADPGCLASRVDAYRALATFNMASVSNLKGLVQRADLVVAVRALPAGIGGASTLTTPVTVMCPTFLGGGGALQRFGPNATVPALSSGGSLIVVAPTDAFPTATNTVYTFPASFAPGPIAGASNPTTLSASGGNMSAFTTDVTSSVNAALNGNHATMSWMLTSNFESLGTALVRPGGNLDCKTSYDIQLRLTHF